MDQQVKEQIDKEPILHIDDLIKSNKSWLEDYMDK